MNSVPICYIADENYFLPTVVSISSLLETRRKTTSYDIYLVTDMALGEGVRALDALRKKHPDCSITHLESPTVRGAGIAQKKNHVSKTALLKYNLCELLSHLDKVLYIDGDTIVQKDLSSLFEIDLGENYVGASLALIGYWESYHIRHYDERVGVPFEEYFNSGVMLLNLAAFRRDGLPEQLFNFTQSRQDLIFMDQDAFNVVCKGRALLLPRHFNLMPDCLRVPSIQQEASRPREATILHFAGKVKPWNDMGAPWSEIYQPYFRGSPMREEYFRLLARHTSQQVKKKLTWPITRMKRYALREGGAAARRYRRVEKKSNLESQYAFAQQHFLQDLMMKNTDIGIHQGESRTPKIIVSLTTIQPRLYEIGTTIESLLNQTFRPDAIVLWLDQSKMSPADLPIALQRQVERGLTVKFCEDIGPHTKLIPALKEFPNDVVITVDDDVLYPIHLVERLVANYRKETSKVYCTRARHISTLKTEDFSYRDDWANLETEVEGLNVLPLGVGGVLYPPGILDPEVFDLERQQELAPRADDIWFKTMSLKKGVICKRIAGPIVEFPLRPFSQEVSLHNENVRQGGNERQIRACFDAYSLWDVLREKEIG